VQIIKSKLSANKKHVVKYVNKYYYLICDIKVIAEFSI